MNDKRKNFTPDEIEKLQPTEKVGLLATINPDGQPHISLITSLQPASEAQMVFGQFSEGLSKQYIQKNPQTGFLLMTLDRSMWRGKADYTHLRKEGPEYEMFNEKPMFRYNTYFGVNTVYYFDLLEVGQKEGLPMGRIIRSALATKMARGGAGRKSEKIILNNMAEDMFNMLDSLKFISWVGGDGYPVIVPVIQCQAADTTRLAFSPGAYGDELLEIPEGKEVAVFAMTMQMEDVLVRGVFNGYSRHRGVKLGTIDINWVYNSMPPVHGQVYPEVPLEAVTEF